MSKGKSRTTPSPQSRASAGRKRDSAGRFVKGHSGNPGGTKQMSPEMKEFARSKSLEGMAKLHQLMGSSETSPRDVVAIVRLFLEYGYGRPAAELDRERLDLDRRRLEADLEQKDKANEGGGVIEMVLAPELEEFAV